MLPDRLVELALPLALQERCHQTARGEEQQKGLAHGGLQKVVEQDARDNGKSWAIEDLNLGPHPYQGCALTA